MHSADATSGDYHTTKKHADVIAETFCAEPTGSANPQPKRAHHAAFSIAAVHHEQNHECCKVNDASEAEKAEPEHKQVTLAGCGCQQQQQMVHKKQPMAMQEEEEEQQTPEHRAQLNTIRNLDRILFVKSQLPPLQQQIRMAECLRRGQEIVMAEKLAKLQDLHQQIAQAEAKLAAVKAARAAKACQKSAE